MSSGRVFITAVYEVEIPLEDIFVDLVSDRK